MKIHLYMDFHNVLDTFSQQVDESNSTKYCMLLWATTTFANHSGTCTNVFILPEIYKTSHFMQFNDITWYLINDAQCWLQKLKVKSREPTTFPGGRVGTSCFAGHYANSSTGLCFTAIHQGKMLNFLCLKTHQHTSPYLIALLTVFV